MKKAFGVGRIQCIDIAKFIGILAIVDVHIESGAVIPAGNTFHVLVFFIIAGLLERKNDNTGFVRYAVKKAMAYMYPYFILSGINIGMQLGIGLLRGREIVPIAASLFLRTITFGGIGTLWFLPVLYLASLLSWGLRKAKGTGSLVSVALTVVSTYVCAWINQGSFLESISANVIANNAVMVFGSVWIAQGFITLGCLMQGFLKVFQEKSRRNLLCSLAAGVILYAVDILLWRRGFSCDLHKLRIPDATQYLICGLSGTGAVLAFSNALTCTPPHHMYLIGVRDFLAWLGRNSIVIMTTHKEFFVTYVVGMVAARFLGELSGIERVIPLLMTVGVEAVLVYAISHSPLIYVFRTRR